MVVDVAPLLCDGRVHSRLYTDPGVFELELERVWYRTWVYVGHVSEVVSPGDHVTRSIGLQPVVLSRYDDGGIHLDPVGVASAVGLGASVPRVGVYRGFGFGSLAVDREDLEEHLGAAASYIDRFVDMAPAREVSLGAGVVRHLIHGNWKMPVENATDGYHPVFLHQSCIREFRAEGVNHAEALGN